MAEQKAKNKTAPNRTGKRKAFFLKYYEMTYPMRKLRRMYHNGASVKMMRNWADNYKTPLGASGITFLIRLGKEFNLNVSQA